MATTIPDGVNAARARDARRQAAGRLHVSGDEARYMLAFLRWRVGARASRPGIAPYFGEAWGDYADRITALEHEVDACLTLARIGVDEVEVDA